MLKPYMFRSSTEAGCDEAGRGCLAGPVVAAAVILPKNYRNKILNDSKQLTLRQRNELRPEIIERSIAWKVAFADNNEIDKINILRASILAMHRAIEGLETKPSLLLIDGNRFVQYPGIDHRTVVRGDSIYLSIAAASVLAKTARDEYMLRLAEEYPHYNWASNKGYPTREHRDAILKYGITSYHRKSFNLTGLQLEINFR
jgi:ribonuclease HII